MQNATVSTGNNVKLIDKRRGLGGQRDLPARAYHSPEKDLKEDETRTSCGLPYHLHGSSKSSQQRTWKLVRDETRFTNDLSYWYN